MNNNSVIDQLKSLELEAIEAINNVQTEHNLNEVKASYIRTDADELTYPLHIMLRYDIEKEISDENSYFCKLSKGLPSYISGQKITRDDCIKIFKSILANIFPRAVSKQSNAPALTSCSI